MLDETRADMSRTESRLDRLVAAQELTRQYLKMAVEGHAATQALLERSFVAIEARINSIGEGPSRLVSPREAPGPLNPTVGR